jgi:hypothetical protein
VPAPKRPPLTRLPIGCWLGATHPSGPRHPVPRVSLAVTGELGFDFGSLIAALAAVRSQPVRRRVEAWNSGPPPNSPAGLRDLESALAEVEAELTSLLGTVLRRGGSNVANTWTFRPGGRQRRHE